MPIAVVELTRHAQVRMQQRRISQDDVESVVTYGREFGTGNATVYVIGRREIQKNARVADLTHLNGLHAIVGPKGQLITTYRDPAFRRKAFARNRGH